MSKNWKRGKKLNSQLRPDTNGNRRFGIRGRLPGGNGVLGGYWWAEAFQHEDTGGDTKTPTSTAGPTGPPHSKALCEIPSGTQPGRTTRSSGGGKHPNCPTGQVWSNQFHPYTYQCVPAVHDCYQHGMGGEMGSDYWTYIPCISHHDCWDAGHSYCGGAPWGCCIQEESRGNRSKRRKSASNLRGRTTRTSGGSRNCGQAQDPRSCNSLGPCSWCAPERRCKPIGQCGVPSGLSNYGTLPTWWRRKSHGGHSVNEWIIDCGEHGSFTVTCGEGDDAGFEDGGTVTYGSITCTTTANCNEQPA